MSVLKKAGNGVVALGPDDTKCGAVETRAEAKRCADLFRKNRESDRRHHRHAAQLR